MVLLYKLLARLFAFFSVLAHRGTGVTWSGEIALRLDRHILRRLVPQQSKIILVVGTNGKTTTCKMIQTVLEKSFSVIHNKTGANLLNGIVGTLLVRSPLHQLKSPVFVFEVDESNLPLVLQELTPDILIMLNLFRDQLDRYGEVDSIAKKWQESLRKNGRSETTLIINGDDPQLAYLGQKVSLKVKKIKYFGIDDKSLLLEKSEHAVDSIYCPNCGARLHFSGVYLSHLGDYNCPKCQFSHPKLDLKASKVETSLEGLYMVYNALAATLACQELGSTEDNITNALKEFKPAFGRQEEIKKDGKTIKVSLSKNPAGFNASLRTVLDSKTGGPILFVLNDRTADGRDVSWIWDVDFESLQNKSVQIFVSGDRTYDLALRLKYAGLKNTQVQENLDQALRVALENTGNNETLWVLPTYTAMLEVRKILTGRSIS